MKVQWQVTDAELLRYLRPYRRQPDKRAIAALWRSGRRQSAGRVPVDDAVPRPDARSIRDGRSGVNDGTANGFAQEQETGFPADAPLSDQLNASFNAQSYGARLEGGYRYAVMPAIGMTPYAALQTQWFNTPSYSETDLAALTPTCSSALGARCRA
jgi:Autotransporter beta-domain